MIPAGPLIGSNVPKSYSGDATDRTNGFAQTLPPFILKFPAVSAMAVALFGSGLFHLVWLWWTGSEWEGPLSLRKPGLFGISGGMTLWSIAWVLTRLVPNRWDRIFANSMAAGLFLEVALITAQQWRGVASHFNRSTDFDAFVESIMFGLISLFTFGICWLAIRSIRLPPMPVMTKLAIRSGLWLLVASCALGFMATFLGETSAAAGNSPSLWGRAGILKYPHGAALHAIQVFPILAYLLNSFHVPRARRQMVFVVSAQVLFLFHAVWQTLHGRSRFDFDWVGGSLLVLSGLFLAVPVIAFLATLNSVVKNGDGLDGLDGLDGPQHR